MTDSCPNQYFRYHYRSLRFLPPAQPAGGFNPKKAKPTTFHLYYSIFTQVVIVAGIVVMETIDPFVGLNGNVYDVVQDLKWKSLVASMNDSSLHLVRTTTQPIYIPWNYQNDLIYIPTFMLENIGLLRTGHTILSIDTFIASVILHMSCQFETLNQAITTAYDLKMTSLREGVHLEANNVHEGESPTRTSLNEENKNEEIVMAYVPKEQINAALRTTRTFRSCFHYIYISCVEKFATTYSLGLMSQILSSTAAICVVIVQLSSMKAAYSYYAVFSQKQE